MKSLPQERSPVHRVCQVVTSACLWLSVLLCIVYFGFFAPADLEKGKHLVSILFSAWIVAPFIFAAVAARFHWLGPRTTAVLSVLFLTITSHIWWIVWFASLSSTDGIALVFVPLYQDGLLLALVVGRQLLRAILSSTRVSHADQE